MVGLGGDVAGAGEPGDAGDLSGTGDRDDDPGRGLGLFGAGVRFPRDGLPLRVPPGCGAGGGMLVLVAELVGGGVNVTGFPVAADWVPQAASVTATSATAIRTRVRVKSREREYRMLLSPA